jgi:8-oxo-dGTP diphosphatase
MTAVFCPNCGSPYPASLLPDEEGARKCPACGSAHYIQLKVGAATIVEQDGRILLLKRTDDPFKGAWGLPAGYVRWNEPPETAAVRETEEECGLVVKIDALMGVYFFDDDPRGNGILVAYRCHPVSGSPRPTPEASDVGYFSPDSLPNPLVGSGQDQAIVAWASL